VADAADSPNAAQTLRRFIFGDITLDDWVPGSRGPHGPPWDAFERARQLASQGDLRGASDIWWQIAFAEGLESRFTLQAWHFLRGTGRQPPADRAKIVLGSVIEMPLFGREHDLLAAYRDGSARYLNYSGKAVVVEDRSDDRIQNAIQAWIEVAQYVANGIGPWTGQTLPNLPREHVRITMLTPSGPHLGQGPERVLSADPIAGPFIATATALLQLIVDRAVP
jgi:hypothetical protein